MAAHSNEPTQRQLGLLNFHTAAYLHGNSDAISNIMLIGHKICLDVLLRGYYFVVRCTITVDSQLTFRGFRFKDIHRRGVPNSILLGLFRLCIPVKNLFRTRGV